MQRFSCNACLFSVVSGSRIVHSVKVGILMTTFATAALAVSKPCITQDATSRSETRKSELGQFMTPTSIADYMAKQFRTDRMQQVVLLDAGAGQGALSLAFAKRREQISLEPSQLTIDAYELDRAMIKFLEPKLKSLETSGRTKTRVIEGDFVEEAAKQIRNGESNYTHAILNPPYKKIGSKSQTRSTLASVGVETVNLYSGFLALSIELLEKGGEVVAIVPRSFCNGPYYKPFRNFILKRTAILSIHLFDSRNSAFAEDDVLQENIIIHLQKGVSQEDVTISKSTNGAFEYLTSEIVAFDKIVQPNDDQRFIRIPTKAGQEANQTLSVNSCTLHQLGVTVSTGPVVDFRLKTHLRNSPNSQDAPLLYPGHFAGGILCWPRSNFKKANAIAINESTKRWLFPPGYYVAVKRFTAKEERRRVVATLVDPSALPDSPIGFENHLNVYHENRGPLPEDLARGIVAFLNTQAVDDWFREFNGHTQVNATDLRALSYPDRNALIGLGRTQGVISVSGPKDPECRK
jgi:adenine-specific DNA-methyltransferase